MELPATDVKREEGKPVVFITGDSTVKNTDKDPDGMWGWGSQAATVFDTDKITVANEAMAGRSTRTYLEEGRWEKVYNSTIGDEGKVENETFQTSLNVGLGVKLLSKLQIYGGYNFALTDGFSIKSATDQVFNGAGKNNMWKVSVAYLF